MAARQLGNLEQRARPAQNALIEALNDSDSRVYLAAAFALSRQGALAEAALPMLIEAKSQRAYPPHRDILCAALDDIARACGVQRFQVRDGIAADPARQPLLVHLCAAPFQPDDAALSAWVGCIGDLQREAGTRAAIACGYRTIQLWEAQYLENRAPRTALQAAEEWLRDPGEAQLQAARRASEHIPSPGCTEASFSACWAACHAARILEPQAPSLAAGAAMKAIAAAGAVDGRAGDAVVNAIQGELIPWCMGSWDPIARGSPS